MKITIEKKEYQLKFGYKVYRKVCQHYGEKTVAGFEKLIKRFGLSNVKLKDPSFDSLNFIGNLVLFAIVLEPNEELTIDSDNVVDVLWKNSSLLEQVMQEFQQSMPTQNAAPIPNKKGK